MDLKEKIKLSNGENTIELPLENYLRVFFVKLTPLIIEYQQKTKKSNILDFTEWLKDKLQMRGGDVLL